MGNKEKRRSRYRKPKEETYMKMLQSGLIELLPASLDVLKLQLNNTDASLVQRSAAAKYVIDCLLSLNIFERSLKKDAEKNGDEDMQKKLLSALDDDCKIVKTVKEFEQLPEGQPED